MIITSPRAKTPISIRSPVSPVGRWNVNPTADRGPGALGACTAPGALVSSTEPGADLRRSWRSGRGNRPCGPRCWGCLLYTSDAADEEDSVDLGGRRIIKKKKNKK